MKKNKNFDSVEFMRSVREKLSKQFAVNAEKQKEVLDEVRSKHGLLPKKDNKSSTSS